MSKQQHYMKSFLFASLLTVATINLEAQNAGTYTPTAENTAARRAFENMKYGMFIHWGASSVLGAGEWVMNNRNIRVDEYRRLLQFFNPTAFSAAEWVATAKNAGMKYITF